MKLPRIGFALLLFGLALALPVAPGSAAGEPVRIRHWQRSDGLPQSSVLRMAQTPDGYLWMVTFSGLIRFDGRRFVPVEDPENRVSDLSNTALLVTQSGELVMSNIHGGVFAYRQGRWVQIASFPGTLFERAAQDEAGDIWMIDAARTLFRIRDGRKIPLERTATTGWCMPEQVFETGAGKLWALRDRELGYIKADRFTAVHFNGNDSVRGLARGRTEGIWLLFADRLEHWVDGTAIEIIKLEPWASAEQVTAMVELRDGRIAVGTTDTGIFIFDHAGKAVRYDRNNGLASDWISFLFVDQEGTLWLGPANHGLQSIERVTFGTIAPPDNWNGRSVTNVMLDAEGALWVGTEGGGIYRRRGLEWDQVPIAHPDANNYVWSMGFDVQRHLWVGTWGAGLYEQVDGEFVAHPEIEAKYQSPASFLHARDGSFWIGSEQGLFRRKDGLTTSYGTEAGLPKAMLTNLVEGPDGAIWFGTNGHGLGCLHDGQLRLYHEADGLFGEHAKSLRFDETGALWVGTEKGLVRLRDGIFRHLGPADGLHVKYIGDIIDDGRGSWWLTSRDGVVCVNKDSLFRRMDGADVPLVLRVFSTDDGLPSIECSGNAARLKDGTLVIPTKGGIAITRPENVITNQLPPPVLVESLSVDDGPLMANQGVRVEIAPGAQRYTFTFTAPTFVAPQNAVFRYQLEGVDKAWITAGPERSASYSFLPPGDYVFSVVGSNGHGVWNYRPARMTLTVLPAFWQTWWFKVTCYLLAAGLLGVLTLWMARRRWTRELEVLERKQALERERARIAKDMHDDLGASLIRISLLTQSAQRDLDTKPIEAAGHLAGIGRTTLEMTKAMDEIVWAVNPSHDSLDGIATYVAAYAQDFLGTAGIACRWNFPLNLPAWPVSAEVRHNLFLAIKEAITNVSRHARATRVDLTLITFTDSFSINVTDDGIGGVAPDPGVTAGATGRGNGIRNMQIRLKEIGGDCFIRSEPGSGTSITFTVTLKSVSQVAVRIPAPGPARELL